MKILAPIAFALTLVVSGLLLVVPVYSIGTSESPEVRHATLLSVNGPWAVVALAIPVLIALVPMLVPKYGVCIAAGLILVAFAVIAAFDPPVLFSQRDFDADGLAVIGPGPEDPGGRAFGPM